MVLRTDFSNMCCERLGKVVNYSIYMYKIGWCSQGHLARAYLKIVDSDSNVFESISAHKKKWFLTLALELLGLIIRDLRADIFDMFEVNK